MRRVFSVLVVVAISVATPAAWAWNAAGHRLVAAIAWRQLSPGTQVLIGQLLRAHPDYSRWTVKQREGNDYSAFLEAATWPDELKRDPRFFDEESEPPTPLVPGLWDNARHKAWHYVDRFPDGRRREGELDRQLERLFHRLDSPETSRSEKAYVVPWVIHLVGDIHQPMHTGTRDDEGGNRYEIENPFNPRHPFTNLHAWWDDMPGPPWLRGHRLEERVDALLTKYSRPAHQGNVTLWEKESREMNLTSAYPKNEGSVLPIVTEDFLIRSRSLADQRLVTAGYRLGYLLEQLLGRVSRETR